MKKIEVRVPKHTASAIQSEGIGTVLRPDNANEDRTLAALLLVSEEGEGSIEVMTKEEVRAILNEVLSVRAYYAEDAAHCERAVEEVAAKHGITL